MTARKYETVTSRDEIPAEYFDLSYFEFGPLAASQVDEWLSGWEAAQYEQVALNVGWRIRWYRVDLPGGHPHYEIIGFLLEESEPA